MVSEKIHVVRGRLAVIVCSQEGVLRKLEIEKLISNLTSQSEKTRQSALISLAKSPPERVLGPLADLILEHDSTEVYAICLDLLERFEAVAAMAEVRADGWFEEVQKRISHVDEICNVMGERLLHTRLFWASRFVP